MLRTQPFFNSNNKKLKTKFGVLVFGSFTNSQKISITQNLGLQYVRMPIVMTEFSGSSTPYNAYNTAGMKIVLNLNYGNPSVSGPVPFPTDMTAYANLITTTLDALPAKPDLVVVENEELNNNYHSGPVSNYVTMLQTAQPLIHARGLKLANAGLGERLNTPCFRWLKANFGQSTADAFGHATMGTPEYNGANNPGSSPSLEDSVNDVNTVLAGVKLYCDYFNVHYYEVYDPNVADIAGAMSANAYALHYIKIFIESVTGKRCMTNETGVRTNTQPAMVTDLLRTYYDNDFEYVIYFSGDDDDADATGLQNNDTTLRPTGTAFKNFITSIT